MSKQAYLKQENKFLRAGVEANMASQLAAGVVYTNLLEQGSLAVMSGYANRKAVIEAQSAAKSEQALMDSSDALTDDILAVVKLRGGFDAILQEQGFAAAHTTGDFPKALATLRSRIIRQDSPVASSNWRSWIPPRMVGTTPDFKQIRGLNMSELGQLKLRPEATDVQYTTLSFTDDGYFIANYERAISYTWEMWLNDEISMFTRALEKLGQAAYRTEALVIFNAIFSGVQRSAEAGVTTGDPNSTNLANARKAFAARSIADSDNETWEGSFDATDIVFGTANRDLIELALNTRYTDHNMGTPNVMYQALEPHMDRLWQKVFGTDWLLFDEMIDWIEVTFLNDGAHNFQSGPATYTLLPDVQELPSQGSFDNHSLAVKVGHALGAKVTNAQGALRVQGS